ncbi:MAG: SAM-dependent methyltransferase, partial [Streptomyces sp.]|nr:SAM-dependent methyltransferase [Streptomyces sp.]
MADAALRLKNLFELLLGAPLPVRLRAWDGSQAGPPGAPALVLRNRRAVRRLLFKPGELGLARAWVAGDLDIDGDLYTALDLISGLVWERGEDTRSRAAMLRDPEVRAALRGLVRLSGLPLPPAPPPEEVRRHRGHLHTKRTDRRAVSHHYDVGNDFYEIVLGPSMVYSCAYWET